ncbi:MAG: thiolase family protein [Proteobacteria bacterium]|nr:thiolase family protein [Pseudomonadota bacterium]
MSDNIYVLGSAMIKFGKYLEKPIKVLTGEALDLVFQDCGLTKDDVEAAWFSNSGWGMLSFQHCIRGQVALSANGIQSIPVINVENACASGSTAFHGAWTALKAGLYDCALAIGVEKVYDEDRSKVMGGFLAGTDVEETMEKMARFQEEERQRKERDAKEKGLQPPQEKAGGHSVFMDFYAIGARRHMAAYGTTQRQLAVIASKNHNNSALNPLAQYTFPVTVDEVIADREVSYPLTRAMCAPIGDGAAAAILCTERFLKQHPSSRAVKVRASILKSGNRVGENDVGQRAARAAYEVAGVGPEDLDVAELHDATAYAELHQTEQMGFCPIGEGGPFAESGATAIGGKLPVNTSGGLISRGHPIGASGLAMIYEIVTQLRGEADKRQVENPRIGMVENGGGTLGDGEAAMSIHIFEK